MHRVFSEDVYPYVKNNLYTVTVDLRDEVENMDIVHAISFYYTKGYRIETTGTVSQVFCYLYPVLNDRKEVKQVIGEVLRKMRVLNEQQENHLFYVEGITKFILFLETCVFYGKSEVVA